MENAGNEFDVEAMFERARLRAEARLPDGHYAEYLGKVAFSTVEQTPSMTLSNAPQVVESVMENTPWDKPNAHRQLVNQPYGSSSVYNRTLMACLDHPEAPESGQVFSQLSSYVQELPADILSDQPEVQLEWARKMYLFVQTYEYIKQKEFFDHRAFGRSSLSPEMQLFVETLEGHTRQAHETILAASSADSLAVIRLLDAHSTTEEACMSDFRANPNKAKMTRRLRSVPEGLYDMMSEARHEATLEGTMNLSYSRITEPLRLKVEEFQTNWTLADINQVLGAFPQIQSQEVCVTVIDAIEDAAEASLPGTIQTEELSTDGLAWLIHFDIYKNMGAASMFLSLIIDKDGASPDVSFGDVTLPREMTPTTSVALLGELESKVPAEDFTAILGQLQEIICSKRRTSPTTPDEWLLTLALLRKSSNVQLQAQVDAFIAQEGFPNSAFQHIIAGKAPGSIYLMPGGKVRIDTKLARGWLLAESAFTTPEISTIEQPAQAVTTTSKVYTAPDKGTPSVPGKGPTKRQRKRGQTQQESSQEIHVQERQAPIIIYSQQTLQSLGQEISPADLAVVTKAIEDNQSHGRHPLVSLRQRTPQGALLCKMRVNGKDGGIRVILAHVGGNQFEIKTVRYRGTVYKDALFDQ